MKRKNEKLERKIDIIPAYDKTDPDPKKNYGIHGCELRMVLKGEKGAVQFVLFTNWQLPHVTEQLLNDPVPQDKIGLKVRFTPMPADLGYHSYKPLYESDSGPSQKSCPYLDGKPCYYDGSGLNAEPVFKILLEKGSEGVWEFLEKYYYDTFYNDEK